MRKAHHPSRRALIVLIATVFVVSAVMVWSMVSKARMVVEQEEVAIGPLAPISVSRDPNLVRQEDSDQDELFDWEEKLRGSNPKIADSDKDGTADGDEVALGRDPLVAGPNDEISVLTASSSAALAAELDAARRPGTLTDDFAEKFAQSFVNAQASGGFDQASQDALVSSLSNGIATQSNFPDRYKASSVPTSASVSLATYANWFAETHGAAFESLATLKDKPDSATLTGQVFINLGRDLCTATIPPQLAALNAETCNVNDKMGQGLIALGAAEVDPVRTIAGIATLRDSEDRRVVAYTAIATYLQQNGVDLINQKYPGFWASVTQ